MRIVVECERGGGFKVHADDGIGWYWSPSPAGAVSEVCDRIEKFVAADLALRRDGAPRHIRVSRGVCPTCGMCASDCVGEEIPGP